MLASELVCYYIFALLVRTLHGHSHSCSCWDHVHNSQACSESLGSDLQKLKPNRFCPFAMHRHRWLVGISYRVVFRRDPIPSQSVKPLPAHSRPHHVHGAIYLFEEDYRPGAQPKAELTQADLEDHHLDHYSGAVAATCKRHYKRQVSTGTGGSNNNIIAMVTIILIYRCAS